MATTMTLETCLKTRLISKKKKATWYEQIAYKPTVTAPKEVVITKVKPIETKVIEMSRTRKSNDKHGAQELSLMFSKSALDEMKDTLKPAQVKHLNETASKAATGHAMIDQLKEEEAKAKAQLEATKEWKKYKDIQQKRKQVQRRTDDLDSEVRHVMCNALAHVEGDMLHEKLATLELNRVN